MSDTPNQRPWHILPPPTYRESQKTAKNGAPGPSRPRAPPPPQPALTEADLIAEERNEFVDWNTVDACGSGTGSEQIDFSMPRRHTRQLSTPTTREQYAQHQQHLGGYEGYEAPPPPAPTGGFAAWEREMRESEAASARMDEALPDYSQGYSSAQYLGDSKRALHDHYHNKTTDSDAAQGAHATSRGYSPEQYYSSDANDDFEDDEDPRAVPSSSASSSSSSASSPPSTPPAKQSWFKRLFSDSSAAELVSEGYDPSLAREAMREAGGDVDLARWILRHDDENHSGLLATWREAAGWAMCVSGTETEVIASLIGSYDAGAMTRARNLTRRCRVCIDELATEMASMRERDLKMRKKATAYPELVPIRSNRVISENEAREAVYEGVMPRHR